MPEIEESTPDDGGRPRPSSARRPLIALAVVAMLLALLALKTWGLPGDSTSTEVAGSITSAHNDAEADYDQALGTGKPIYVLFHSLS